MTREINAGSHSGPRQEWRTARLLARLIVDRWGIDLDAMATKDDCIVECFIGPPGRECEGELATDALNVPWAFFGRRIFCNPPFAIIARAVHKAIEAQREGASVIMLAPDNGDTRWYAALVDAGANVYRFRGRPKYEPARRGVTEGGEEGARRDASFDIPKIMESAPGFPSALYELDPSKTSRAPGDPVPTFVIDCKTLEIL